MFNVRAIDLHVVKVRSREIYIVHFQLVSRAHLSKLQVIRSVHLIELTDRSNNE